MPKVGVVSYGTQLPRQCVASTVIAELQRGENLGKALGVSQKTVPASDEDTITLSVAAAEQALSRTKAPQIGCLFIGSESHPYAVKPSGTVVASALGLSDELSMADLQFACKAGSQSLQIALAYAAAGWVKNGLAIGADTAQGRPGDVLEFTAAAGAAAYIVGQKNLIAELIDTVSVATDTPDFWRRPGQEYPEHAGRFTAEPAYFHHVQRATHLLLQKTNLKIHDFQHCVFHTPNGRFPQQVSQKLGCSAEQMRYSLPVKQLGNTYAAASLLALANVLDHAGAGEKILVTSYGSGSGSDSFAFVTTERLVSERQKWSHFFEEKLARLQPLTLAEYQEHR